MQIDGNIIKAERIRRAWSQEQLANATGLSLRTIQRIEKTGIASNESVKALAAVFGTSVQALSPAKPVAIPRKSWGFPKTLGAGLAGGVASALLMLFTLPASAVGYDVQAYLNGKLSDSGKKTADGKEPAFFPVKDGQSKERARIRVVANEIGAGNVRFDITLYDCDADGCKELKPIAMVAKYGSPAVVEWDSASGNRVGYTLTPRH